MASTSCVWMVNAVLSFINSNYHRHDKCVSSDFAGIAIGGDVFPGSTLSDHCLRFQNIPQIKLIVVLGELGGTDEYSLVDALKDKKITKPVCLIREELSGCLHTLISLLQLQLRSAEVRVAQST